MLRSFIICPDVELAVRLETAATRTGEVSVNRVLDRYPTGDRPGPSASRARSRVLFLSFESLEKAQEVVRFWKAGRGPADHRHSSSLGREVLRETMRVGVREFLADPFDRHAAAGFAGACENADRAQAADARTDHRSIFVSPVQSRRGDLDHCAERQRGHGAPPEYQAFCCPISISTAA